MFVQKYVWKGELNAGTYYLLPFTSGCRLKKMSKKGASNKPVELVYRTDTGELDLSRELRWVGGWVCVSIYTCVYLTASFMTIGVKTNSTEQNSGVIHWILILI